MLEIIPGATIIGKSGNRLVVDKIDGDIIHCGKVAVRLSAVVEVIPPTKQTGDRVRFVGSFKDWGIDRGEILTVVEDCGEWVRTHTAGKKPISVLRSDLGEVVKMSY